MDVRTQFFDLDVTGRNKNEDKSNISGYITANYILFGRMDVIFSTKP